MAGLADCLPAGPLHRADVAQILQLVQVLEDIVATLPEEVCAKYRFVKSLVVRDLVAGREGAAAASSAADDRLQGQIEVLTRENDELRTQLVACERRLEAATEDKEAFVAKMNDTHRRAVQALHHQQGVLLADKTREYEAKLAELRQQLDDRLRRERECYELLVARVKRLYSFGLQVTPRQAGLKPWGSPSRLPKGNSLSNANTEQIFQDLQLALEFGAHLAETNAVLRRQNHQLSRTLLNPTGDAHDDSAPSSAAGYDDDPPSPAPQSAKRAARGRPLLTPERRAAVEMSIAFDSDSDEEDF